MSVSAEVYAEALRQRDGETKRANDAEAENRRWQSSFDGHVYVKDDQYGALCDALRYFAKMDAMNPPEGVPLNEWLPAVTAARAALR